MSQVMVLEFNEINQSVLLELVKRGVLPNFKRLIESGKLATTTVSEEYAKLEPWIQWVTAHTGKSQAEHKAFNLSDGQHSQVQQIWDVLESRGVPCGLVSPMNASKGKLQQGFFIPDPWTVSKDSYPAQLEPIYNFLAERVQKHNISLEQGASKLGFLMSCLKAGIPLSALVRLGSAYVNMKLDPKAKWKLAAALDRFLWDITAVLRDKYKTPYTGVFMNSVAHFQHHYWTEHASDVWKSHYPTLFKQRNPVAEQNLKPGDDPITFGMINYDQILGEAIRTVGIDSVVVLSGLSQVPFEGYEENSGFYLYRPIDHEKLFTALRLPYQRIAPLMSRDAMLYFRSDEERSAAIDILTSTTVNALPLFHFTSETDSRLFVKVIYSYDVLPDAKVNSSVLQGSEMKFSDYFVLITFKTGHHSPEGTLIAPKAAFGRHAAQDVLPLQQFPELVFRMLAIDNAANVARDLSLSPA